ncbi:hypothetical protein FAVG1_12191 [Fusarium avenaceum]|nr:hypothetical protein FAVG1_12191 [Fusarium avenaceum]
MGTASYRHTQTDYEYLHQLSKGAQDKNNEYVTSSQTRGAGVTIHILDDGYRPIYLKAPATTTAPESYAYSWPPGAEGIVDIDESRFVQNYTSIPLSNRLHGFNVANYAAGKTLGTATDANVCIQKVTSWYTTRNGETESRVCISLVLEAFEEILEHAEQEKKQQKEPKEYKPFKVINCSWGVDPKTKGNQDIVSAALDSILASGCIVVASAGNHGVKLIPGQLFPLNKEGVITVGAVDKEDQIWQKFEATVKTGGSNFGDMVEIYAPGVDLPLYGKVASKTKPGEWVKTVSASELHTDLVSSQIATPLVSGIVAGIQSDRLADSRNPLSTKAIRDLLQKSFSKPTKSKSSVEDKNPDLSMKINTEYRVLRSFT